jgi:hypothetical protein
MSVNPISTTSYIPESQTSTRQDLQALQKARGSNDLSGAQDAFSALKDDFHAVHGGRNLMQTHVPMGMKQDFQDLQSALNSGDLAAAQQAFATVQQDMQRRTHRTEPPQGGPRPEVPAATGIDVSA